MGKLTTYDTGATRDSRDGKLVYDKFLSPVVLKQFAKYMNMNRVQSDGELRAGDNWQKGISIEDYFESLMRHIMDAWFEHRGIATEQGLIASMCGALFNVMGYLHEYLKEHPMQDFDGDEPTPEMVRRLAETKQEPWPVEGEDYLVERGVDLEGIEWPPSALRWRSFNDGFDEAGQSMADRIDKAILNDLFNEAKQEDAEYDIEQGRKDAASKIKLGTIPNIVRCNCEYCNPAAWNESWSGLCFGNYDSETCPGCPDHTICRDAFGPDRDRR